ncbi:nitroreductase family deazaflavin-dependent oxidoreductase [Pseudonocardia spinosispora]|uniref:nitroreductase family deazaflavin-dependent oxidoreductase n=1 Tax=Pseudonocardia spinosispora TaxID=103441 RepID=UPI00041C1E7A|nr:nitroreductase family deazaflavin-dependent oxidoreductase [Pseudonocardia spinosispora]
MTTQTDSPVDWVGEHIKRYVESDGAEGHDWRGYPTLLLTTTGRNTGAQRRTALIYGTDGDRYLLVASHGGAPEHPNWYRNLLANPEAQLQVWAEKFTVTARTARPEEKPTLWRNMIEVYPPYGEYQGNTDRDIPVVILERV